MFLLLSSINHIQHKIAKLREELRFIVGFTPRCLVALGSSNESLHPYVELTYKVCLKQYRWRHVTCLYMEFENWVSNTVTIKESLFISF